MHKQQAYDKQTKRWLGASQKKWLDQQRLYEQSDLYKVPFIKKIVQDFNGKILLDSIKHNSIEF